MSPLRSSAGPAVCTNGTSSSSATMRARLVLPSPGGPASSTWSSASPRAAAAAIETPSCSFNASWPTKSASRRGRSVRVQLVLGAGGRASGAGRRPACGCSSPRALERVGDEVLRRLARRAVEQLLGLLRAEAEPDEPVAREQPRVVAAERSRSGRRRARRRPSRAAPRRCARPCACRSPAPPAAVPCRPPPPPRAARAALPPPQDRQRHLRPDALHADQQQEEVALRLGGEAVQEQRVVAHDQVRVERGGAPRRRHLAQRLRRHREPVAHAAAGQHHVVGPPDRDLAATRSAITPPPSGWPPAAGRRSRGRWRPRGRRPRGPAAAAPSSASSACTIRWTWPLPARPEPQTAPLTCWGV